MFFIVWGFKTYTRLLGILTFVCGSCQNPAAQRVEQLVRKFTLFWVPLFPVKKQTLITCTYCGVTNVVAKEHTEQLLADLATAEADRPHLGELPEQLPEAQHPQPNLPNPQQGRHRA